MYFFVYHHSSPFGAVKMLRITICIFSGREVNEVGSLGGKKEKFKVVFQISRKKSKIKEKL